MGDIVTVCLMRHAPTKENLEKRYLGWTDAPLADPTKLAVVDTNVKRYMAVTYNAVDKRQLIIFPMLAIRRRHAFGRRILVLSKEKPMRN